MEQRIRELLENLPPKSPRSKLEVHREVIGELRRRRWTYEEIAQFLGEHLDVSVAPSTIHAFVAVRAKRRSRAPYELPANPELPTSSPSEPVQTAASARERIEALKRRPTPKASSPRFEFHEGDTLTLSQPGTGE